jgi:transcriptional regulator with PAS, ATPase and Fis domain
MKDSLPGKYSFGDIVGQSPQMREIYERMQRYSETFDPILITGETGTGKTLVAKGIARLMKRDRDIPFEYAHIVAKPDTLIESELFGYKKGAFTGAAESKDGKFHKANGGILFIDEIGDLPGSTQSKILEVLDDDGRYEPLGSNTTKYFKGRIISATNKDLEKQIKEGKFREDLFYRISALDIDIPPLREREEDIPLIAQVLILNRNNGHKQTHTLAPDALEALKRYPWHGNVRELSNFIKKLTTLADDPIITEKDVFMNMMNLELGRGNGTGQYATKWVINSLRKYSLLEKNSAHHPPCGHEGAYKGKALTQEPTGKAPKRMIVGKMEVCKTANIDFTTFRRRYSGSVSENNKVDVLKFLGLYSRDPPHLYRRDTPRKSAAEIASDFGIDWEEGPSSQQPSDL